MSVPNQTAPARRAHRPSIGELLDPVDAIPVLRRIAARSAEAPCPASGIELPCWEWNGSRDRKGYGQIGLKLGSRRAPRGVHRVAYTIMVADPGGLDLDHLCRNPPCWNPWHLEPVTSTVNTQRGIFPNAIKTHCDEGHPFDEANLIALPDGRRDCRECNHRRQREYRERSIARFEATGAPKASLRTHCAFGHLLDEANTFWGRDGYQGCRTCRRRRQQKYKQRIRDGHTE